MDKLLKPRILETEPNEPEAEQIYKHWLKTFQGFLTSAEATRRNGDNEPQLNKLSLLFNYVSHRIYLYIEDSTTYEETKQGAQALNYSFRFYIVTGESKRKSAKLIDDKKHVRSLTLHRAFEIYADSFPWTH